MSGYHASPTPPAESSLTNTLRGNTFGAGDASLHRQQAVGVAVRDLDDARQG